MAHRQEALPAIADIDLDKRLFNDVYYPHLLTVHNYEVYYGGNGSGKSSFVLGQKMPLQMTLYPGRNLVCLRKQKSDCIMSCWGEVYNGLKRMHLLKYWELQRNPRHMMINRINGNHILFEGLDNVEDIKSIKFENEKNIGNDSASLSEEGSNVTDIIYEEVNAEDLQDNVEELDDRIRDPFVKGRLILIFNPVRRTHWLFKYVTIKLAMEGVDSIVLKTTYKDNHFLPKSQGEKLERHKFTNPYRYQVYTLGNWGTMGETVFNANAIQDRLNELGTQYSREPCLVGNFLYNEDSKGLPIPDTYQFIENPLGKTRIYRMPSPKVPYVLSADTAGEGKDFYIGMMRDNITGEQVAVFRDDGDPDECVWQIYGLARMFGNVLFGPEINMNDWIVKAFQMMGHTKFYRRMTPADKLRQKKEKSIGWRTGPENRQLMLIDLIHWTGNNMKLINDVETLNEMLLFTYQEKKIKGSWMGAEPGAHDDCFVKGTLILTNKGRVPIENIKIGDMVLTRDGYKPVVKTRSRIKKVISRLGLTGTPSHPIITTNGEKALENVKASDIIYMWDEKRSAIEETHVWNVKQLFTTGKHITDIQNQSADNLDYISGDTTNGKNRRLLCIGKSGLTTLEKYLMGSLYTIKTITHSIMKLTTSNVSRKERTVKSICFKKIDEINLEKTEKYNRNVLLDNCENGKSKIQNELRLPVSQMEKNMGRLTLSTLLNGAKNILKNIKKWFKTMEETLHLKNGESIKRVYNLQVYEKPEYFANNILVHNCVIALAVNLQVCSQQACEMQPDKSLLTGTWMRIELEDAIEMGRIDRQSAREYIETHGCAYESGDKKYQVKVKTGGSRYARR